MTGIVLVTEMTASVTMLLPMLGACFVAMLVPTLMHDAPVYDPLRDRTLEREEHASSRRKPRDASKPNDANNSALQKSCCGCIIRKAYQFQRGRN